MKGRRRGRIILPGPKRISLACLALGLLALFGCQGGRILNNSFVYQGKGYKVNLLPGDWVRTSAEGFDLFFSHPGTGATVGVNGTCQRETKAPLKVLTRHLLFGLTDRKVLTTKEFKVGPASASETIVEARLNETLVKMSLVVVKRGECLYDLAYVARSGDFEKGLPAFEEMVNSLQLF